MRVLWFSHLIPYPPRAGNLQRSFNLIRQAARHAEVSLVAFNMQNEPPETLREYEAELRKVCASVEFWEMPFRWRGARWWAELGLSLFSSQPITCRSYYSHSLAARWADTLKKHDGALIHLDIISLALFAPAAASFRMVLNHHNCESAMAFRRAENHSNPAARAYLRALARKLECAEAELCSRVDANLVVSALDGDLLRRVAPTGRYFVVDNGVDTEFFRPTPGKEDANTVIFVGSLDWYPNVSGLEWYLTEVWPKILAQRPATRFLIAGRKPGANLRRLADRTPHVTLIADPPDVRPIQAQGAVFACPILDGGGTRLKILDALAAGKALVSTTIGAEGLRLQNENHLLMADTPRDFAAAVVRLLDDENLRRRLAADGRTLVEQEYSWNHIGQVLHEAYCTAWAGSSRGRETISPAAETVGASSGAR